MMVSPLARLRVATRPFPLPGMSRISKGGGKEALPGSVMSLFMSIGCRVASESAALSGVAMKLTPPWKSELVYTQ